DVASLKEGEGTYATFLTRLGKIVADLALYRRPDHVLSEVAPGHVPRLIKALDHYIIMEDVTLEDLTESLGLLGLHGPECWKVAGRSAPSPSDLPEYGHREVELGGVRALAARRSYTGEEGLDLFAEPAALPALWAALRGAGASPVGLVALDVLRLEAGVPLFGVDMDERVNPMQAGLEERAISFTKGCYVGQEVVAKIKYLGQVNRGLVGLTLEGEEAPPPRSKVLGRGKEVGELTSAARSPALGRVIALGYLHRDFMEPGSEVTVQIDGGSRPARVTALPFYRR
ncbi:MAG: aminomethyltransferase family protein, partial [Nitrospinota bacterium]